MKIRSLGILAVFVVGWAGSASAELVPEAAPVEAACDCLIVPALTPVSLEIAADLGSKTSKSGDSFPIRLAAPIMVDGREAVPAGADGMGEVVHAKKSGGMGAAGELVLAARWLQVGERRLRLRSLKLVPEGRSRINTVNAINTASAAGPLPIGLIGYFISGGQAVVPKGTIADARTAETMDIPRAALPQVAQPISTGEGEKPDDDE